MDRVALLLGHSFMGRFSHHAEQRGQTVAQAAGLADVCEVHTQFSGGGTFTRLLARPQPLLATLRTLPPTPEHLGTNDLCPGEVVVRDMRLLVLLCRHFLLPQQVVFLTVIQRTSRGCRRGVENQALLNVPTDKLIQDVATYPLVALPSFC